jgi:ligand-binding sensor domain-containing protein
LYLLQESERKIVAHSIELPAAALTDRKIVGVTSIAEGADGSLWVGGQTGLVRRLPDGKMLHYPVERASDYDSVLSIAAPRAGRIFVGHSGGLFVFQPEPLESLQNVPQFESRRPPISQESLESSGEISLPDESGAMLHIILRRAGNQANDSEYTQVSKVFAASDDRIWATANGVLYVFENNTVRALDDERGLPIHFLGIAEDGGGNLWFGSSSGAIRLTKQGFTNFGRGDGLFPLNIQSLYQTEDNKVYAVFGDWRVAEIAGDNLKTAH